MSRISRVGADAAETTLAAKPDPEGRRIATIWIESLQHAAGLLLGLDSDIEVFATASVTTGAGNARA